MPMKRNKMAKLLLQFSGKVLMRRMMFWSIG